MWHTCPQTHSTNNYTVCDTRVPSHTVPTITLYVIDVPTVTQNQKLHGNKRAPVTQYQQLLCMWHTCPQCHSTNNYTVCDTRALSLTVPTITLYVTHVPPVTQYQQSHSMWHTCPQSHSTNNYTLCDTRAPSHTVPTITLYVTHVPPVTQYQQLHCMWHTCPQSHSTNNYTVCDTRAPNHTVPTITLYVTHVPPVTQYQQLHSMWHTCPQSHSSNNYTLPNQCQFIGTSIHWHIQSKTNFNTDSWTVNFLVIFAIPMFLTLI